MNDLKTQLTPSFSPVNIGLLVILFVTYWPFALLMLGYILFGSKLGLDLSNPQTFGVFFKRIGFAWRAAIDAFKQQAPKP